MTNKVERAMTVDKVKLKALAEGMKGWDKMTECWPCDENGPDWQVGRLDEEDDRWPLLTIDTEQYDQEQDAPKIAQYYAAANPAAVLALLAEIEQLKAENEALAEKYEAARDRKNSITALQVENEVARMRIKELDLLFGRYLLGMRAAVIDEEVNGQGMRWIYNALAGPGELPPEGEENAQAYFDREIVAVDNGMQEVMAFHEARCIGTGDQPPNKKTGD
jgi:hypothetical protein